MLQDKELSRARDKINQIDLEPVLFTLVKREDWTLWDLEKAKNVENLYRSFLTLIALYPEKNIVPTKDIDTFWHTHILDTEKYIDDCNKVFGYYIHHFPYFGLRGAEDEKYANDSFKETCELFLEHFSIDLVDSVAKCSSHCRSACGPKLPRAACKGGKDDDRRPKIYS